MKRKLTYLIAFLVIVGVVVVPAAYMNKVFSADRQGRQAASAGINGGEKGGAADRNQAPPGLEAASPGAGQASSGAGQAAPASAVGQTDAARDGGPAPLQQAAAPEPAGGDAAVTPPVAPESVCAVWIAVVGKNGEQLYQAGQVLLTGDNKWGINALGALEATGLPYTTSPTWRDFIYSISGQANSGVSGWMYSVNGDVPMHMADKHPVKAGDRVIWWYSNSMEQPQPRWDELIQ